MLVAMIFLANFHVAVFSVCMAIYVAAGGHQADECFCRGVMAVLGVLWAAFFIGVFFPLVALCLWRFFADSQSPYPLLVLVGLFGLLHHYIGGATQRFFGEAYALEFYHSPAWLLSMCRNASHGMGTSHLLAEKPLRVAAERRAAHLRAQMMGAADVKNGAASAAPASISAGHSGLLMPRSIAVMYE